MCGIFGFIGRRSLRIEQALAVGTRSLAHRGPDDEGVEIFPLPSDADSCVGMGSRRLAIQDLSLAAHQPMHDPCNGNWLVFNGEIYNFQQVRADLEKLGDSFSSRGDTEVLLKAYGKWGRDCLPHLAGMFAFAIWDARRETLLLVRDRLGEKPLYYASCPEGLVFGSEVRSLLASGLVPKRLDRNGLESYLAFGALQDPLTIIDGIKSLPPGCLLIWNSGGYKVESYWSASQIALRDSPTEDLNEAADHIHGLLGEAVSLRLVSDVPLGIFLSGGIDSSAVLAFASEVSPRPLETFSVIFGEEQFSEANYADIVAKTYHSRHHPILLSQQDLLKELPEAIAAMDQPTMDGMNTYVISKATKVAGVTVALSGMGGDEVFGGYRNFRNVPRMMRFRALASWTSPVWRYLLGSTPLLGTDFRSKLLCLLTGSYPASHPYFLARSLFLPDRVRRFFAPDVVASNNHNAGYERLADMVREVENLDAVNQVSVLEASAYMANMLLRDTDFMSMAHAVEVRVPLLDHHLWEYVLPLRGRLKLDRHLPKPLLLKAVRPGIPEEIYHRPKMGFQLPFAHWMRDQLRPELETELNEVDDSGVLLLKSSQISSVWGEFLRGRTSWSRPWALYVLKQWVRRNFGGLE